MWDALWRMLEFGAGGGWGRTLQVLVLMTALFVPMISITWIQHRGP
jgi:hypothetical protein